VRGREQDPHPGLTVDTRDLIEDLEVEDRLLDRDRDELLRLELQGRGEITLAHEREIGGPDDDALAGHPQDDRLGAEATFPPEAADGGADRLRVDDLAVSHCARRQGYLPEPQE
jgi:hypothetical protein